MEIKIRTEHITLGQFLKLADFIGSGGQAKLFIETNTIKVNGTPIIQRGKKLYPGDIIMVNNESYSITGGSIASKNT